MSEDDIDRLVTSFFHRPLQAIWDGHDLADEEIRESLAVVIEEITGIDRSEVTAEKRFIADLGIDSLSAAEIAVRMEDKHGIPVHGATATRLLTVGDAVQYIRHAMQGT